MKKLLTLLFSICILFGCDKEDPIVTQISFESETMTLQIGSSTSLTVSHSPSELVAPIYTWNSSDDSIVSVTQSGEISALELGDATITVKTEAGLQTSCIVTVLPIEATSIKLSEDDLTLDVGDTHELTYEILPENTTNKTVVWSSSDETVATVKDGVITAVGEGSVQIKIESENGTYKVCQTTVNSISLKGISFADLKYDIEITDEKKLDVIFDPIDATNKNIRWESSNNEVVTINKDGVIKGLIDGAATITATSEDGDFTATCGVTVKVNGIELTYSEINVLPNETKLIWVKYLNQDKAYTNATWISSDPNIATVTGDGVGTNSAVIETKGFGTAIISAITEDGIKTVSCNVNVVDITSFIKTNYSSLSVTGYDGELLTGTVKDPEITNNSTQSIELMSFEIFSLVAGIMDYTHYSKRFSNSIITSMHYGTYTQSIPINGWYKPRYRWKIKWNDTIYVIEGNFGFM